ncbi:uncharacterized protein LOC111396858 isoform X3 [Olea europaea var. sylvestris]|uniref:uncharacterized protein LOC111396858 isoform X3 n=1 Tax=Olea europaea var. sylvestris TaxID=158386 RepID=UPI000C1D5644|nr:uncharacterized protein LOC111396858 isoform X3 [Olea europaea var. sylvestris]
MQGVGPNLAISFSVYDTVRSYWHYRRPDDSTGLVSLACGSLSGIASSTEKQVEVQASLRYLTRLTPRARGPNMLILEYGPFVRNWLCYSWLILGESSSAVTKL